MARRLKPRMTFTEFPCSSANAAVALNGFDFADMRLMTPNLQLAPDRLIVQGGGPAFHNIGRRDSQLVLTIQAWAGEFTYVKSPL